ncbi:MAG: TolC family protein, partial [Nitrospirae bacterium]
MKVQRKRNSFLAALVLIGLLSATPFTSYGITLQEGLQIVTKGSREVLKAIEEENQAEAKLWQSRSYWLPQVELYGYQTYLRYQPEAKFGPFGPVPMSEKEFLTYGFKVSQLVYDFGSIYSSISASKEELRAKRFITTSVRNTMALEFIKRYLGVLEAEKLLEVAEGQRKAYEEHLADARAMYENGLVTKNDLLQAEVSLAEAEQERINAENLLRIKRAALNVILKSPPDEEITLVEAPSPMDIDISLEEAYKRATEARPELIALRHRIEALKLQKSAVKRQFLPKLYLAGGYEYQQNQYMVHEGNWSLVAGLKVELFSGGLRIAQINELDSAVREAEIEEQRLREEIKLQVKSAYLSLHSARHKLTVSEKAVAQAEENYRLHRLRYKEGVGTSTDVTDALVMLKAQKTNYYRALYDAKRAEAELLYAIGADLVYSYTGAT